MASLHLQFGNTDLNRTFTAHPYKPEETGWDYLVFESFPTSDVLVLTGEPSTNNHNNVRVKVSYEKARSWGDLFQSSSAIYFDAYASGRKYAVKAAFNIEMVTNEHCASFEGLQRLTADAKFYGKRLHKYDVSPKHYGLWRADTEGWGGVMLFTVMDWGGYSWDQLKGTEHDTLENRIILGRTIEVLHDYNIRHGRLNSEHHILFDPELGRSLLIDFSQATHHPCRRILPILPTDAGDVRKSECTETFNLIYKFGFMDLHMRATPETKTWRAIYFLKRYRSRFRRLSNTDALMVQRHHFFDDPPLFADKFGFQKNGELVYIHENSESEDEGDGEITERLSDEFINALLLE